MKIKLKERRKENGITQLELAQKIGCKQEEISRWESGKRGISLETAYRISQVIGCRIDDLIDK